MDKTFNPDLIESEIYANWEQLDYFAPVGKGKPYALMIPPPNVTGSLHMGHAFQDTLMDALVRYQRMMGADTLWQVGTDHAGIATQMVVERKILAKEGKSRDAFTREEFISKIWQWKELSGNQITKQLRRLGASLDWKSECFTMDDHFTKGVQEAFIRLYNDGLIYRGKRLVNWDTKLQTAISDLEVENKEVSGSMWYIRYFLAEMRTFAGDDFIVVGTTRPETLIGDAAIAVNPKDPRYKNLIGTYATIPVMNRQIPIIADEYADMSKGTGCVKITPAHDFNDYQVGKKHRLPLIKIMDFYGNISQQAEVFYVDSGINIDLEINIPESYQGLDRFVAREKLISQLQDINALEKQERHNLVIPFGDRSGVIVEPMLTDQWFVRTAPLAKPAVEAVKSKRIQFVFEQYENMYFSWMQDIQDWCISRQLWWGHRIPAWFDSKGNIYVGTSEKEVRDKHQLPENIALRQDPDVLDTWFSSSLWTFVTLGWPDATDRFKRFHPTDVLVSGFDIIFFWIARMIMMTLYLIKDDQGNSQVPFKYIYLTGLIRDDQGQKMSKSKGNVIDPIDMIDGISLDALIEKRCANLMQPQLVAKIEKETRKQFPHGIAAYGTDALRFTLASLASTGRDINWDMQRLEGYKNFCNKIWNGAKYVLSTSKDIEMHSTGDVGLSVIDRWINSQLQKLIVKIHKNIAQFRFDHVAHNLYDFIWNEYCSWYLELTKPIITATNQLTAYKQGTQNTLMRVLEQLMRLAHPLIPFITEKIWQNLRPHLNLKAESIMLASFPLADTAQIDEEAEQDMEWLKTFVTAIRVLRAKMSIAKSKLLVIKVRQVNDTDKRRLSAYSLLLKPLANISELTVADGDEPSSEFTMILAGSMEVLISLTGLYDAKAELNKLSCELENLNQEIARVTHKLSNEQFIQKAPKHVIEKEQSKLDSYVLTKERLALHMKKLELRS